MTTDSNSAILVLGIGNLLWGDEGFGVRTVEALDSRYEFPPDVQLMDGGTQGLFLLPYVKSARRMIILDAVDYSMPPGSLKVVWNEEIPAFLRANKLSMHQIGFQEVLALARLQGEHPEESVLIGVQPEDMSDFGGSLRDSVRARIPDAIALTLETLARWGAPGKLRTAPPVDTVLPNAESLRLEGYESGRPGADQVCREGDARFLNLRHDIENR
ncbi:MAG TPA: HyaD/HybD family hydrogenase maturation endopeptidase [Burkholderiales bacterium]